MTPPKPPRKSHMMKNTITYFSDIPQSACKDLDASVPAVTYGSESEVIVKPIPRARTMKPNAQCNISNTVDAVNITTNNTMSSQLTKAPPDLRPARPLTRPAIYKNSKSIHPKTAVNGGNHYIDSITETTSKPPAISTVRNQASPSLHPPLPSIYYDKFPQTMLKSESCTDESQESKPLFGEENQVSPASSEERLFLFGTYGETTIAVQPEATNCADRPVRPRHRPTPKPRSGTLSRPPPPSFRPPPVPTLERNIESIEEQSESFYSEIKHSPYLDVLPEDDDKMTHWRSTIGSGQQHPIGHYVSFEQTKDNPDDIKEMLGWLKKVSKTDSMASSLYGLSIEEEIRSFNERAVTVRKALHLFNLLMLKNSKRLQNTINEFSSISNSMDKMQKKTKNMDIAGGTAGAVGGVTAILGIALAPLTAGASLIATAVGAGMVASAGGMGAHTAKANEKIVNRMTVEKLVYEYRTNVCDLDHCLDFILSEMNELRRHDIARLQRAGACRDALKTAHLSQFVCKVNTNNGRRSCLAHAARMSSEKLIQEFSKDIDLYFTDKDDQKLRKSTKSKFSGRVQLLARNLQDELTHLNRMWELFS